MPDSPRIHTVNLVGPGRLGRSLGRLIAGSAGFRIAGIAGPAHLDEAAAFIGCTRTATRPADLDPADLWLLAVPDDAIVAAGNELADSGIAIDGAVVAHCSGAGSSELLAPLRARGAVVGSLHPIYSFADPARAVAGFAGTPCAVEGDPAACATLTTLAQAIGGRPFQLASGGKAAYHAALCIASNYLVTLSHLAQQSAALAGLDAAHALPLITGLMRQTLDNIAALGPETALTGPIARGDTRTIAAHLRALAGNPALTGQYQALGRATLELAKLSPEPADSMARLLEPPDPKS